MSMKNVIIGCALSTCISVPATAASAQCNLLIDRAQSQSDILRAPSAIGGVGDSSVVEQSAIAGVQLSLGDRKRAALLDDAAATQCLLVSQQVKLAAYVKYAPVLEQQAQARAENNSIAEESFEIAAIRNRLTDLVNAKQATIVDQENFASNVDAIQARNFDNDSVLSIPTAVDTAAKISDEVTMYETYTAQLERITGKQYTNAGWDVSVQAGARIPIYSYSGNTQPFGALTVRYSFGSTASRHAAERAAAESVAALKETVNDPVSTISDLLVTYKGQKIVLDTQIDSLRARLAQYDNVVATIQEVNTPQAFIVYSSEKMRQIQLHAQLSGLRAKRDFIQSQIESIEGN